MRFLVLLFLLLFSILAPLSAQPSADCVDAHILANTPTLLSNISPITIDSLTSSGDDPREVFSYGVAECGTDKSYTSQTIDKSYWFGFSAVTNGTLEFMITPENNGTDYDFILFEGFCPTDPCSNPIFCSYIPSFCTAPYSETGVAVDPLATFGVSTVSLEIHEENISLSAGQNYYLLVENRNEITQCGVEDSLGFTIQFAGTAEVGRLVPKSTIDPISPLDTSIIQNVCAGDIQTFSLTSVPFADNAAYDWNIKTTIPDLVNINKNPIGNSIEVQFGETSGQICMEMTCPIQSLICWDINVDMVPDLVAIPDPNTACEPVDLTIRFQDNNNVSAPVAFYASQQEATMGMSPLASNFVNTSGEYWARKTTPNGCFDIVSMDVMVADIEILVPDTFRFCSQTRNFSNFRDDMNIQNANGNLGDLVFFFFEDSLEAVNKTNPFAPPVAFDNGSFWVRAESINGGPCFDIKGFEFVKDEAPEIGPISPRQLCGNACYDLADLPLNDPLGQPLTGFDFAFYSDEIDATMGTNNNLLGTEICQSGTYWVRAFSSPVCFDITSFEVNFLAAPDIDPVSLEIDCVFGCINLADQVLTEKNGLDRASLQFDYYATEADANDPTANPLLDQNICNPTEVWVRVLNTDNACTDVAKITITGMQLATAALAGDSQICAGESASMDIAFTGNGPFTLTFTDGINLFDTLASGPIFSPIISPETTTTFTLMGIKDVNGCNGTVTGSATVIVNNGPIIENLSQDCNLNATEYILSFDIKGESTYTVQGVSGNLAGNSFISDLIPTGSVFSFQVIGTDGCPEASESLAFSCECNSEVAPMDSQPLNVCDREAAIGTYLGPNGENLEKEDILVYVLHDSPDVTLGNVIAFEDISIFTFDPNSMQYGTTYYMSAVVTKQDILNNPVLSALNNPCIAVSEGTPVTFYPVPEVNLSLSSPFICQSDSVDLTFNITGVGPFDVNYFDGEKLTQLTRIPDGHTVRLSPNFTTSFFVEQISQSGVQNCFDTPMMNTTNVDLMVVNTPIIDQIETQCNEAGTMLVLVMDISGGDPSSYTINGLTGNLKGNQFISDSIPHNTPYSIAVSDANNCPTIPLDGIAECFCTDEIGLTINMEEPVSCRGQKDAVLLAVPENGKAPYTYFWSTGATTDRVADIAPGNTFVTMTDANGCVLVDTITLVEPTSITATYNVQAISCYGERDGGILIVNVMGGSGHYTYSFNGSQFQPDAFKEDFPAGNYDIEVKDDNGCLWNGEAILYDPPQLDVSLGGKVVVNLGDTLNLKPQANQEMINFFWESNDFELCDDCLIPVVKPTKSGRVKVIVLNSEGCMAEDEITIQVQNQRRIFIPSVFSPNGDGRNDLFRPFSGEEVLEIGMFRVYNRWGELLYEKKDMEKNSGIEGWDGVTMEGRKAPPGVYLYFAEVMYKNGSNDVLTGDVSLIR